jgi:hypothetical protein
VEVSAIPRQLDLRVHDSVALAEIDLYTDVLSAVAAADRPLTEAEIDEVLGLTGFSRGVKTNSPDPPARDASRH